MLPVFVLDLSDKDYCTYTRTILNSSHLGFFQNFLAESGRSASRFDK